MIRILHILHSMDRGGAENALMNYYRHINRDEMQFDFLLTSPDHCQFEDEILAMGGRMYRIPRMTKSKPFEYLAAINTFFKEHKEYKIVHSHTSSKSVFPLFFAKIHGVKVRISHSHNTKSEAGLNGKIRDFLKKPLLYVANNYFACGEESGRWLYGDRLFNQGKVRVIPNVIEGRHFEYDEVKRKEMRRIMGVSDETVVIGCTARFNIQKNHSFLLDVFTDYYKKNAESRLLLIGDGDLRESLESKAKRLGIYDKIIFTGVVPNVADYEQAMDIFAMTSLYEGLPLSVVEAQIAGLPCLVTDVVTKEVDLTGLVSFLSIRNGCDIWVCEIEKQRNRKRRGYLQEIIKAGYDAETSAKSLQQYYMDLYNVVLIS